MVRNLTSLCLFSDYSPMSILSLEVTTTPGDSQIPNGIHHHHAPTGGWVRPKRGQIYVLPARNSRLVMEVVAWRDSLQVNSIGKRESQNTRYTTRRWTRSKAGGNNTEGEATKVCGMQATEGRWVGCGVLRLRERTGDTGLRGIWKGQGLKRACVGLETASGENSG